ncbi:hypothetical protein [Bacillus clarus]|uniref:Transposase for insertion sequence element IS231B domain protein n=1 Tax=Bacillus clarus TaxID=2338372 RepID=A0A090YJ56_9BACI|nr:hypothetical protein [Bacillus clarus]KFM98858.1 transposase for insertion sequence element IS231B domain protein [Bacillus clarus]
MSISVSDELQLFAPEIPSFLSPNILRGFARKVAQELIQLLKETSIENPDVKEDALDFVEEVVQKVE